jgi:isoleucyl-tRNA synthetase
MKEIIAVSKQGKWAMENATLLVAGYELLPDEYNILLKPRMAKGTKPLSNNKGMISLDPEITKELEDEGIARDIIRLVQQARKDAGFNVSDKIQLELQCELNLSSVIKAHGKLVSEQTLSNFATGFTAYYKSETTLLDHKIEIRIRKI